MVIEGKHKTFKLRHGTEIREFRNVTVRRPQVRDWHEDGTYTLVPHPEDRWELIGIELKKEAYPDGSAIAPLRVAETEVTVGFLPENIVED